MELSPDETYDWLIGEGPLPGGDEMAYQHRNVPDYLLASRPWMARKLEDLQRRFPQGATLLVSSDDPRVQQGGPSISMKFEEES